MNDTDAYTYPPIEAAITTEAALIERLTAQLGGEWWENGRWPCDGAQLAVYTLRPSDPAQIAALLAYVWAGPMRGEWWDQEPTVLIEGHLVVFDLDTTKSGRDDMPDAWDIFSAWIVEGTPQRLTNRAGAGTKGTRALAGVGPVLMAWR